MSATPPMERLMQTMRKNTLVRIYEEFDRDFADVHLKDLTVDEAGPGREIVDLRARATMSFRASARGAGATTGSRRWSGFYNSICSAIRSASSTSAPRYRTILLSLVCPSKICTARRLPVFL